MNSLDELGNMLEASDIFVLRHLASDPDDDLGFIVEYVDASRAQTALVKVVNRFHCHVLGVDP